MGLFNRRVVTFCLIIGSMVGGVYTGGALTETVWAAAEESKSNDAQATKKSGRERYEYLGLFNKVLYFIENNYVEEVKTKELVYGAIKGMMDTLDPHSNFLPPEIFKDMKTETSGKFGGIGIEIGQKNSILTVVSPIEDTPAHRAGVKAGDKILKINGESTKGMSLAEAVAKMRGKRGSPVMISIWRNGFEKAKEFKIVREEIKIQTTKFEELENGYLYVKLTNFNEHSASDVRRVVGKYEKKNGPLRGLVFDLRNNPGGLLDQAVDVTSLFIDEGVVVSTMGRAEEKRVMEAKKGMARKDIPLAVLVNGASASASEIVAGALQDHKRAVIMGQPTFGKGSVQSVIELQTDVGLKLTIARYYTPSGRSIQLKGIQPDVLLDDIDQKALDAATKKSTILRERDLKHHMEGEGDPTNDYMPDELMADKKADEKEDAKKEEEEYKPYVAKEDYQVRQALNYIKSYQIFRAAGVMDAVPVQATGTKAAASKASTKKTN